MQLTEEEILTQRLIKLNAETQEVLKQLQKIQRQRRLVEKESGENDEASITENDKEPEVIKVGDTVNLLTPGRGKIKNTVPCTVVEANDKIYVRDPNGKRHWRLPKNVRKAFKLEK